MHIYQGRVELRALVNINETGYKTAAAWQCSHLYNFKQINRSTHNPDANSKTAQSPLTHVKSLSPIFHMEHSPHDLYDAVALSTATINGVSSRLTVNAVSKTSTIRTPQVKVQIWCGNWNTDKQNRKNYDLEKFNGRLTLISQQHF